MRRVKNVVPIEVAKERALTYLASRHRSELTKASAVGSAVWPDVSMTAQGLGGAGSRILRRLKDGGFVEWVSSPLGEDWGYRITAKGRKAVESGGR